MAVGSGHPSRWRNALHIFRPSDPSVCINDVKYLHVLLNEKAVFESRLHMTIPKISTGRRNSTHSFVFLKPFLVFLFVDASCSMFGYFLIISSLGA